MLYYVHQTLFFPAPTQEKFVPSSVVLLGEVFQLWCCDIYSNTVRAIWNKMSITGAMKRKEQASSVSPEANRPKKQNQGGDTCAKWIIINDDEECSIQCQWCQSWVHSKCANLKDDECDILHQPCVFLLYLCTKF